LNIDFSFEPHHNYALMKWLSRLLLSLFLGILSATAYAALPESSGIYLDLGGGVGVTDEKMQANFDEFSEWFGAAGSLGYQLNMFMGAEAGVIKYPDFDLSGNQFSNRNWGLDLAAKLIMPFNNGIDLFGKLGWVRLYQNLSGAGSDNGRHEANTMLLGAGISLFVDQSLGFTLQGSMTPKVSTFPEQFLGTLGVVYIF